jgi:hypothetical protein
MHSPATQCDESTCRDVPVRQIHDLDDIFLPTRPPSHPSPTRIRKETMLGAARLPPKASVTPRPSKPARNPTARPSTARACSLRRTTQKARTGVRTRSSHGINAGLNRGEVVDGSLVGKASSPESQYERVDDDRHEQEQEASCDDGKTGAQDATHADSLRTMVHSVARLSCSHSMLAMTRGPAETTVVSSW